MPATRRDQRWSHRVPDRLRHRRRRFLVVRPPVRPAVRVDGFPDHLYGSLH